MGPWYATRENVKDALDIGESARANQRIDRALQTATDNINSGCNRVFYPWVGTRYFDWPNLQTARSWRLWLNQNEIISLDSLVSGGVTIAASDYNLEPAASGPPYNRIEIKLSSSAGWSAGQTPQRSIAGTGVFGYRLNLESVGSLSSQLGALSTDTAGVTWTTARFGVGDLLKIDDEYMVISERTFVDSTQDLQVALTASAANVAVSVSTGSSFAVDETILIDSERMLVVDIAGNVLTVKRAQNGSVLASHAQNTSIYTLTGVTLQRGQCGTTNAVHASASTIYRQVYPGPIVSLCLAETLVECAQLGAGYARTVGSGDNQREARGAGLADLRKQVYEGDLTRKVRMRGV